MSGSMRSGASGSTSGGPGQRPIRSVCIDHPNYHWHWATVDSYAHWLTKTCWPHLQKVALWWGEVQLSSLDAERAIALSRVIDVPNRRSQTWGAFKRELVFKMHGDYLDALLVQSLGKM